jgi:hypothetical protein
MEEVTYRKCPDCMHTIPSTAIVCMYCGATLGKSEKKSTSTLKKVGIGVVGFISLCFVLFVIAAIFVTPPERIDSNSTSSEERLAAAPTWTPTAVVVAVAEDQEPIVEDLPIDAPIIISGPIDTPTPEPDIPTVVPTVVPVQPTGPIVNAEANLRSGPGTSYEIIGKAQPGQSIDLEAKNQAGDWYQLASGAWIAAFLVDGAQEGLPIVEVAAPPAPVVPVAAPVVAATAPPASNPQPFTCAGGCATPPDPSCSIKGNVNVSTGTRIYHMPGGAYYNRTNIKFEEGDRWFCTEAEAQAANFRRAER